MATRERMTPIQSPPKSKTPSLYSRMKAAGTRALSSRNETRQTAPPVDLYSQGAEPVRESGRPSFTYDQTSRYEQDQARPSTTQPGTRRRAEDPASSKGFLPHADSYHSQLPRASSRQHIAHQVNTAYLQPSFVEPQRTYTVQPRRDSRPQQQEQVYNSLNLPNHLFPQPQGSQNVLRRKPSIIADYVTESRATFRTEEYLEPPEPSPLQGKAQLYQYQQPASVVQRQTPEYPTRSLRHAGRTLVTPESFRSDSRAAKSITPSSPSTYRHDTPSVFSHASRATSRTAYSPASAMLDPQTWDTDFPVPPLPENLIKSATVALPKQPFIPPELAHLAFVAGQKNDGRERLDDRISQVGNHATAPKSPRRVDLPTFHDPRHYDDDQSIHTAGPTPLKAMDPALRSRVTLNTHSVEKTLASAVPKRAVGGGQAYDRTGRRSQGRDKTAADPKIEAVPRSSTANNSARVSTEKPRQSKRTSVEKASPRLSFQCQGTAEEGLEPANERIHSASVMPQTDRPARAQLSRAFSFSRASLKTKSSIESLKSKLSFAQRMLVKTKDQMSCVGPVDTSASMFPAVDHATGSRRESQSVQRVSGASSHAGDVMAQSRQVPADRHAMSSSSRTSFDRSRPSMTTSRLPNTVSTRDNPSRSRLDVSEKATHHASHSKSTGVARKTVDKPLPISPNAYGPPKEVKVDTVSRKEDFPVMAEARNSSGSDSTSTDSTTRAPPLARLNSADSGRSSVMAGYGLFPKTSLSPINRKVALAPAHDAGSREKTALVPPKTVKAQAISDEEMKLRRNDLALRLGALTASTSICGKVLFSPADFMMQSSPGERILVVDGTGEDWSHFLATTYPCASISYLPLNTPARPSALSRLLSKGPQPNHTTLAPFSLSAPLPLPSSNYTAAILRFPPALPTSTLTHLIAELKRIIRPGGHIELIALDLDLSKMGSDTRHAVRDHKIRMHNADASVSLKPASDSLQRLLAHRGFEGMRAGIVVVPAAGEAVEAIEKAWVKQWGGEVEQELAQAAEMFRPADVGRWWYKQCYEDGVDAGERSIWDNEIVRRECARLGTGFKVLICHAQKPVVVKRRTASV